MIEFAVLPVENDHQVPQTFVGNPLAEQHGPPGRPAGEFSGFWALPVMAGHQVIKNM